MATACETNMLKGSKPSMDPNCSKDCEYKSCPPDCQYKKSPKSNTLRLIFTAIGILIAVFATYMIVSSDSKLYLIFWIFYSVLRRLMVHSKSKMKTD